MMKKIKVLFFVVLVVFCAGCGGKKEELPQLNSVYDTNQYQICKQVMLLVANSDRRNAVLVEEIKETEKTYRIYEVEDIVVQAEAAEEADAKYTILKNGVEVDSFTAVYGGNPFGITISYVDITRDGTKDIIIIGESPRGTLPRPHWTYAYDIKNNHTIDIFQESGELTEKQVSQLNELFDEEFENLFPEHGPVNCTGGCPYVDEFGEVYYTLGIWHKKYYQKTLGEMIVFFSYNKDSGLFDVSDLLYMPYDVKEEGVQTSN